MQAINLLAARLRDPVQAVEYCRRIQATRDAAPHAAAAAAAASAPNLYLLLINAYMQPAEGAPMLRELHDLLLAERSRLDPLEVRALPRLTAPLPALPSLTAPRTLPPLPVARLNLSRRPLLSVTFP